VRLSGLTPRETEILKLIAAGNSSKQIAKRLGISFKTVVAHRSRLMDKLDVHNVAGLVRYAVRKKLD
jgi:DNA-binding CsgD family transcriptional regulator